LSWQVSFQAYKSLPPFKLKRKLDRCMDGERHARRFITAVRRCDPVPMRCIQVDRPDGLYLVGRNMVTTHNSSVITTAGSIQELICDQEITIGIFSVVKAVAARFVRQLMDELESNAMLRRLYPDVVWERPKAQAPLWSKDEGFIVRRQGN